MRSKLRTLGLSSHAVSLSLDARRPSTNNLYSLRWSTWVSFAAGKKFDPLQPSPTQLANFLSSLHLQKGFKACTLLGYKSSVTSTIAAATGVRPLHLIHSSLITNLIDGIKNRSVRKTVTFPKWDVFLVLNALRSPPFEPLSSASLRDLTLKTVFLVSLATARRVSGIHAISGLPHDVEFAPDLSSMTLSFLPEFRAKNQLADVFSAPIVIPSLTRDLDPDDPDRFLCPVRAIKAYLDRTASHRATKRALFISLLPNMERDISKQTIARWLVFLIKQIYKNANLTRTTPVRAHEIRAISSSLSFVRGVPLTQVMHAAYWRSVSTFTDFYLRTFSARRGDETYGIKKAVLSQSLVSL